MSINERQAEFATLINEAIRILERARKLADSIPYQHYDMANDKLWEIVRELDLLP